MSTLRFTSIPNKASTSYHHGRIRGIQTKATHIKIIAAERIKKEKPKEVPKEKKKVEVKPKEEKKK